MMMNVILIICPTTRIVEAMAEATPYCVFSTELMMVFILGEEKRANPHPSHTRTARISPVGKLREQIIQYCT